MLRLRKSVHPIVTAASKGDLDEVQNIVKNKVDVLYLKAFLAAAKNGQQKVVEDILNKNQCAVDDVSNKGRTALLYAAKYGHKGLVEFLLSKEANKDLVDSKSHTALYYATKKGYSDIAALLSPRVIESVASDDGKDDDATIVADPTVLADANNIELVGESLGGADV